MLECYLIELITWALIIYFGFKTVCFLYSIGFRARLDLKERYGRGTYALVTGGSDGIGKGIAEALAAEGFNLIIAARTEDKLIKVAKELESKFTGVVVKHIVFDFSKNISVEDYKLNFGDVIEKYNISILVNNVGTSVPAFYGKISLDDIRRVISMNTFPQVILSKLLIEKMLLKETRSAIINLSSSAANVAMKTFGLYSATKAFNDFLSRGMAEELQHKIDIMVVKPLGVESPLSKMKANGITCISPIQCANGILDCLGYEKETEGHWSHRFQGGLINLFPRIIQEYLGGLVIMYVLKKQGRQL